MAVLDDTALGFHRRMQVRPFTLRHEKALQDGAIEVSLPERVRRRMLIVMQGYNERTGYTTPDNPGWVNQSTALDDAVAELEKLLGLADFEDGPNGSRRSAMDPVEMVLHGPDEHVLDLLELYFEHLSDQQRASYQTDVNQAMVDFGCPWRLCDGLSLRVDAGFLEQELLSRTPEVLGVAGFEGARQELLQARDHLAGGDGGAREAIWFAGCSFESSLKAATKVSTGQAKELLQQFATAGFLDDLPSDRVKAILKPTLLGLAVLRNELGGHGQGQDAFVVPRAYGELAVHLAAALDYFVVQQYLRKSPSPAPAPPAIADEDIPF